MARPGRGMIYRAPDQFLFHDLHEGMYLL